MKMSIIDYADSIVEESFGLSAYLLFTSVKFASTSVDVDGLREDFLEIIKCLLMKKRIILITPGADVVRTPAHVPKLTIYDKEAQWNTSPENAVQYLRDRWPKDATSQDSLEIVYYLYEIPGIIWVADDGSLHAS